MPSDLQEQINQTVAAFLQGVEGKTERWLEKRSPTGFRDTEMEVAATCRELADGITSAILLNILDDPAFQAHASATARSGAGRKLRNGGRRSSTIRLLGVPDRFVVAPIAVRRRECSVHPEGRLSDRYKAVFLWPLFWTTPHRSARNSLLSLGQSNRSALLGGQVKDSGCHGNLERIEAFFGGLDHALTPCERWCALRGGAERCRGARA